MAQSVAQLPLEIPAGFDDLTSAEKLQFLAALWERADGVPAAEALQQDVVARVVDARLGELQSQAEIGISADEVMRRVRSRIRR